MDAIELFFYVTLPILTALIITLLTLILERKDLRKLDNVSNTLNNVSTDLSEIKRDFSGTISRTMDQLIEIIKHPPSKAESDPLPPDKIKRRDFLLDKGRREGLTKEEADELRELLREQAIEAGLTGLALLAFLAIVALMLGYFLSRGESNK